MPQKPYLILGSIRQQMQYPRAGDVSEETLMEVLREVDLGHLPEQFGGLDAEAPLGGRAVGRRAAAAGVRAAAAQPPAFCDSRRSHQRAGYSPRKSALYSRLARVPIAYHQHRTSARACANFITSDRALRSSGRRECDR